MSEERRDQLVDALYAEQPKLKRIVTDLPTSIMSGSWDMIAYSYHQGFEALWDHAIRETSGFAELPLLMVGRQSMELSIKAAIRETTRAEPPKHHRLTDLFDLLLKARREIGGLETDDDDLTPRVRSAIVDFEKVDRAADRFRYPISSQGDVYEGFTVDLERLFQAHELITSWCSAASNEAEFHHLYVRRDED